MVRKLCSQHFHGKPAPRPHSFQAAVDDVIINIPKLAHGIWQKDAQGLLPDEAQNVLGLSSFQGGFVLEQHCDPVDEGRDMRADFCSIKTLMVHHPYQ